MNKVKTYNNHQFKLGKVIDAYSDSMLLELLKEGKEAAIEVIYDKYWRTLLAIAYIHIKDKQSAEEIVQEVLVKLWERRNTLEIRSLPDYLAMSVKYAVLYSIRKDLRHKQIANESISNISTVFNDEEVSSLFLKEYINGIVEKLPEKCRIVFKFSREEGFSNPLIAKKLSISEKTVEAHLTKALKQIRISLKKNGLLFISGLEFLYTNSKR